MPENSSYNLIIADDDRTVRNLIKFKASQYGFLPVTAADGMEAIELINENVDVVILDLFMPKMDGFDCLDQLSKSHPHIPIVILSGENDASAAMKAVKLGAHDYITKPFDLDELFTTLRNARKLSQIQRENLSLRESIGSDSTATNIVTHSAQMTQLLSKAKKVARLDSSILITGESGTGKGAIARYIHSQSPRAAKPFITVSCPALPRELLESELFGHEKGAFTGAVKKRIGKIEAADGGTLFLDEIGDLPIDLQPKLLNVLQDKEFYRLGGEKPISSNTRIITATNSNFEELILNKSFREDLYYRISVIPLHLPPLRERPGEILPLTNYFLNRINLMRVGEPVTINKPAEEKLLVYSWPGNVRQLENLIERAAALCEDNTITPSDLNGAIDQNQRASGPPATLAGQPLNDIEKNAIQQTLTLCKGNKAKSARILGITEKTIYNKMKKYNLT